MKGEADKSLHIRWTFDFAIYKMQKLLICQTAQFVMKRLVFPGVSLTAGIAIQRYFISSVYRVCLLNRMGAENAP
jgi:hypothetical protein